MIEVSEVRRRLREAIEAARRDASERRAQVDAAEKIYDRFLEEIGRPVFRQFIMALKAEGYLFRILTPAGALRLESEAAREDFIELWLDTSRMPPEVMGRVSRGRGSRITTIERPVRDRAAVDDLTDNDVLAFLVTVVQPFVTHT